MSLIKTIVLLTAFALLACSAGAPRLLFAADAPAAPPAESATASPATKPAGPVNQLSREEADAGFKLLFDGTTKGWRVLGGKTLPAGWDINEEAIHHKRNGGGGDITVDEEFENYELRFDFKIAAGGNSGLKYRVQERPNNSAALGIEYQVVDQIGQADNKGKHSIGSLYDLVDAKVAAPRKAGEWNEGRIVNKGNHMEHWLNGAKVAELDYGSEAWKTAYAASKFTTNRDFAAQAKGHIILQDHQDEVWFRNIRIRELKD